MKFKDGTILAAGFVLISFYVLIKYGAPLLVEHFFFTENFSGLNLLSFCKGQLSLSQYQGYIDQRLTGPATQIISGLVLVIIALKWFKEASAFKFFLLIVGYFALTKFEALFFPCYGEVCALPMFEGIWLYENKFDYAGLIQQNSFGDGGPKAYIFSTYPTYIALLYKFTSSVKAFLFSAHTINFVSVAVIVTVFRSMAQKVFNSAHASLAAIVFLSVPLIQSNAELINMEIAVTFFAFIRPYFCIHKKFGLAFVFILLSVLTKGSGAAACAAFFAVACIIFVFDNKKPFQWVPVVLGAVTIGVAFLQVLARRLVYKEAPVHSKFEPLIGIKPLIECDYLMIGLIFVVLGFSVLLVVHVWKRKTLNEFLTRHYVFIVMFIFTLMWYALYLNVSVMGPRYKVLLTPFMVFSVIYLFSLIIKHEKIFSCFLIGLILLAGLGSYGLYYPKRYQSSPHNYNRMERTLEYRNDMWMTLQLAKVLSTEYAGFIVGAPFVLAQKLAVPELGYVAKPLDVVLYAMGSTHRNIRNFEGLSKLDLRKTIWIGLGNTFSYDIVFPIDPQDRIIKDVFFGYNKATLFMGGIAIERVRVGIERYKLMMKLKAMQN